MITLKQIVIIGGALAGIIAIVGTIYWIGHRAGSDSVQSDWNEERAGNARATTALVEAYREAERKQANELQAISDDLNERSRAAQELASRTIADLRGGNLQLRERFRGCRGRLSEAGADPEGDDDPGGGGLSKGDEEFLVRLAERADKCALRLRAWQERSTPSAP